MMDNDRDQRTVEGRGRRQKKFCTSANLGQGRGRNCNYRRAGVPGGSRPQSIAAVLFDRLDRFIARSKKTMALLSSKNDSIRRIDNASERLFLDGNKTDGSETEAYQTTKQKQLTDSK